MKKYVPYAVAVLLLAIVASFIFFWRRDPVVVSIDAGVVPCSSVARIYKNALKNQKNRSEDVRAISSERNAVVQILIRDKILRIASQNAGLPTRMGDLNIDRKENFVYTNLIRLQLLSTDWAVSEEEIKQYLDSNHVAISPRTLGAKLSNDERYLPVKKYLQHLKEEKWFEEEKIKLHVQVDEAALDACASSQTR